MIFSIRSMIPWVCKIRTIWGPPVIENLGNEMARNTHSIIRSYNLGLTRKVGSELKISKAK